MADRIFPGFAKGKRVPLVKEKVALWVFYSNISCAYECSVCEEFGAGRPTNFCPHCGAYMVNKVEAEEYYESTMIGKSGGETNG